MGPSIKMVCWVTIMIMLSMSGHGFTSWEFWLVLVCLVIIDVTHWTKEK